ncbi:MAG TPA: VOC family protein [Chryseolinea sp.]|nr:VOC family protein [Chryseolinea sp.]
MLLKMNADVNALNWFDIPVADLKRAKKFYETILDIEMETTDKAGEMAFFPRKPNTIMGLSGILSGALVKTDTMKPGQDGPLIYLNASPSVQPVIDRVEKAGGRVLVPRTQIPAGFMSIILDTEGNKVGLHAAE